MSGYLNPNLLRHSKRVCSLYKRAVRNLEAYNMDRTVFRYQAVLMRAKFDENKDIKDLRRAKELLIAGEEELLRSEHYQPIKFPHSPGGVAYAREVTAPDWVLDYWHPLEKAQYPEYFARREQRKKEYLKFFEQQYGKPPQDSHH
ncbi:NADH dehydrogenase [ubiquinone] 1 beta subcomplex subunit 9 [Neocloeon triangulifer]|uniref:NADH dehydrogenase [ubiquinone] 1 beta subcomplex subunit 9 n=1 Tax=Neocloeon triangulifer TaxID=2078957 RepID=UPI00286EF321|nr:NADH dehydrogenase [ubiquinone] 1 beta subcomplex subunit 9 [Neocloeon triangulifer]